MSEQDIIRMVTNLQIEWSSHAIRRMTQRNIPREEILGCLLSGEIIEEYPNDLPFPSFLVLGYYQERPLHVVCSIGQGRLWIITVYRPTLDRWESNFRTRRR